MEYQAFGPFVRKTLHEGKWIDVKVEILIDVKQIADFYSGDAFRNKAKKCQAMYGSVVVHVVA